MQFLPRQFHQPVEAARRLRHGQLLFRGCETGVVSLRCIYRTVCRGWFSLSGTESRRSYEFAVVVRRSGKLIGACDLALAGRREADIGYMLAPRHWGFGYGTEVAAALVDFGFRQLALERLSAVVAIENERSRRVLGNAGLVWEGLMRRAFRIAGRSWDCHRYTIDRPRWLARQPPCAAPAARGS